MAVSRFKRLILGTGLTGTDNGDDTITIDAGGSGIPQGGPLTQNLDADGFTVENLDDPTNAQDAATKAYVDASSATGGWTVVEKTADETVNNNSTVQNDDELFFTVAANGVYEFEMALIFACAVGGTASDLKLGLGEDNTTRGAATAFGNRGATDSTANLTFSVEQDAAVVWGVAVDKRVALARGYYQASGSGGTFRLVWAQNSAVAFDLTIYAGSVLRYRQLG